MRSASPLEGVSVLYVYIYIYFCPPNPSPFVGRARCVYSFVSSSFFLKSIRLFGLFFSL